MKRMIACSRCRLAPSPHDAGEWFKRVRGSAKKDMVCDWCGDDIKEGGDCAAESMGVYGRGIPYYKWEHEYIERG